MALSVLESFRYSLKEISPELGVTNPISGSIC